MTKTKTSLFILLISVQTQAQTTSVQRRDNKPNFRSELMHSELLKPQYDYSILLQKTDTTRYPKKHMGAMPNDKEVFYNYGQNDPPFNNFNDGSEASLKAITPSIGINFGANNLAKGKGVSDNTLSISNGVIFLALTILLWMYILKHQIRYSNLLKNGPLLKLIHHF